MTNETEKTAAPEQQAEQKKPSHVAHDPRDVFLTTKIEQDDKDAQAAVRKAGAHWDPQAFKEKDGKTRGCWYLPYDKLANMPQIEKYAPQALKGKLTEGMTAEAVLVARYGEEKAAELQAKAAEKAAKKAEKAQAPAEEAEVKEPAVEKKPAAEKKPSHVAHDPRDVFLTSEIKASDKAAHATLRANGAIWDRNAFTEKDGKTRGCWYLPYDKLANMPQIEKYAPQALKGKLTEGMTAEAVLVARYGEEKAAELQAKAAEKAAKKAEKAQKAQADKTFEKAIEAAGDVPDEAVEQADVLGERFSEEEQAELYAKAAERQAAREAQQPVKEASQKHGKSR